MDTKSYGCLVSAKQSRQRRGAAEEVHNVNAAATVSTRRQTKREREGEARDECR